MKKLTVLTVILALGLILTTCAANANDVDVYEVTLQNLQGTGASTTVDVKFSASQKNVFPSGLTDGNSQPYYDRVWIFVKYFRTDWAANTAWKHATLAAGGTVTTYSGGVGISADGKGAFVKPGANQTVRWNIGNANDETSSVDTSKTYKVRVYAIEMVLVPTGPFWAGDNATSTAAFRQSSTTTTPWHITQSLDTNGISVTATGDSSGAEASYYYKSNSNTGEDADGTVFSIPAAFPKGYTGFYIMKYEISQQEYCNFLNTLTRKQQGSRVAVGISADAPASNYIYVMASQASGATTALYRNNIVCPASGNGTTNPITFTTSTPHRACNFLCWADLCAYADWAGLRPMTELEFEKACRGQKSATDTAAANVVSGEYAWGPTSGTTNNITQATTLSNDGTPSEGVTNTGNGLCCYGNATYTNAANGQTQGPLRSGFAATSGTTRVTSGASYYGAMDLSGNLWERPVTAGNATGRAFDGTHGDGYLVSTGGSYDGNANGNNVGAVNSATNSSWSSTALWPGYTSGQGVSTSTAAGSGFRGGSWYNVGTVVRVSDRYDAAYSSTARHYSYGGRCARTSP